MRDNVLLFGGGLDSVLYLLELQRTGRPFVCVHVEYGQLAAPGELASARYWCNKYGVTLVTLVTRAIEPWQTTPNALMSAEGESLFVEGRNLGLILAAVPFAVDIYLAITKLTGLGIADHKDASERFITSVNTALECSFSHEVRVLTPWSQVTKADLVRQYLPQVPELFERSWTCFFSTTLEECGRCRHCVSKQQLIDAVWP